MVVTPAAGYIGPVSAIVMGALGAMPSYFALIYRAKTKLDDSLDVVAAHGLGGATGAILTGVFADAAWSGGASGLLAGHPAQVADAAGERADRAWPTAAARPSCILKLLALVMPLRITGPRREARPRRQRSRRRGVHARRRRDPGEAEGIGAATARRRVAVRAVAA